MTAETAGAVMDALLVQGSVDDVEKVQGVSVSRNVPPHHVFVCSHIKRDKRCGLIGPYLSKQLTRLIKVAHSPPHSYTCHALHLNIIHGQAPIHPLDHLD